MEAAVPVCVSATLRWHTMVATVRGREALSRRATLPSDDGLAGRRLGGRALGAAPARVTHPRVNFHKINNIRFNGATARCPSSRLTMPHAIAIRSAAIVSPALPAAVKYRARLVPGSL